MITNNYWQFLSCIQRGANVDSMYDINNGTGWYFMPSSEHRGDENRSLTTSIYPQFGVTDRSGRLRPMSPSDYTVDGQDSKIVYTTISGIIVPEEGLGLKRIYTITGYYDPSYGGVTLYLKRVGLVKTFVDTWEGGTVGATHSALLAEVDLEQPIAINPQDAFSITLCWNQG